MDPKKRNWYYQMYTDVWRIWQKYYSPNDTEEFWDAFMEDCQKVLETYKENPLCMALLLAVTNEIDRIHTEEQKEKEWSRKK